MTAVKLFPLYRNHQAIALGAPEVIARRLALFAQPDWSLNPAHTFEAVQMVAEKWMAFGLAWQSMALQAGELQTEWTLHAYRQWLHYARFTPWSVWSPWQLWQRSAREFAKTAARTAHQSSIGIDAALEPVSARVSANARRLRRRKSR